MKFLSSILAVAALSAASMSPALANEQLAQQKACLACHGVDKPSLGPAFKAVAAKYRGQKGMDAKLAQKVIKGGGGALTREKMQGLVLKLWKETGKTVVLITHSVEEALLLGERLLVMAPRPGRIFREYNLPFAERGVNMDLREVKKSDGFSETREEILSMIWGMEEEIMGKKDGAA